jgi:hypothetical protein
MTVIKRLFGRRYATTKRCKAKVVSVVLGGSLLGFVVLELEDFSSSRSSPQ